MRRVHDNFASPTSTQEVEWLNDMWVMFKRQLLEQAGLFDEQFCFDYGIGDLLLRAQAKGRRIIFDPEIRLVHLERYSRNKVPHLAVENKRSLLTYHAKHRPEYYAKRVLVYDMAETEACEISTLLSCSSGWFASEHADT